MRGDRLNQLREERGLSQGELAKELETNTNQIGRWERNEVIPNSDTIIKLATYFNVSSDYLLGLVDSPQKEISADDLTEDEQELIHYVRNGMLVKALKALTSFADELERQK